MLGMWTSLGDVVMMSIRISLRVAYINYLYSS